MVGFILALLLLGIALLALALQKTYSLLPRKELKRRVHDKDPVANVLYKAVAYGASLRLLLWVVVTLSAAGSFVLLSQLAPPLLAFITVAVAIAYGFVWMPAHQATKLGVKVAVWATPAIAWLLRVLHPLLDKMAGFMQKHRPVTVHTGLYEREDLLKLIESQKHQVDSRISTETLELLAHTLTFGDKLVRDTMVPARAVRSVAADEAVAPIIIRELHDSGFSRFPVHATTADTGNFVGTLYLRDLVSLKHTGKIGDVMQADVYYVHEDHPLEQVLDAFLKTQHHLFIVVNSFEEFVGIITREDILEEILGCKIVDEFDQYDDLRAVAAHHAHIEHDKRQKDGKEMIEPPKNASVDEEAAEEKNSYQESTLKHLVYEAGFRGEALEIAYAVALAESGGKATAHNDNESTGDDSYGLFQINMLGAMGPERRKLYNLKANKDLFHPPTNARVAFAISEAGKNWQPWSAYTNGAYKKYYDKKANASITK
jgi:CBS domain containing-hemolysin-like protein